jgi:hypothetical protein
MSGRVTREEDGYLTMAELAQTLSEIEVASYALVIEVLRISLAFHLRHVQHTLLSA